MTRPADMTDTELEETLADMAAKRADTLSPTRKLVIGSVIDALLDERWSRHHTLT